MTAAPIFLSASIPNRDLHLYPVDRVSIREAVRALIAAVLPTRPLVFGGHPAISPLVWEGADSLGLADRVFIYQSELFRPDVPPQAHFFQGLNRLVWTPINFPGWPIRDASLDLMRGMMIDRRVFTPKAHFPSAPPDFPEYAAAVFIGGMDGVEDEWQRFTRNYPQQPALLVASTSGAAGRLLRDPVNLARYRPDEVQLLENDRRYRHVFRTLLP